MAEGEGGGVILKSCASRNSVTSLCDPDYFLEFERNEKIDSLDLEKNYFSNLEKNLRDFYFLVLKIMTF